MNSVLGSAQLEVVRDVLTDVAAASTELNRLDGLAGDGDLGITVTAGTSALLALLPEMEGTTTSEALRKAGMILARAAPSSCGTLLARKSATPPPPSLVPPEHPMTRRVSFRRAAVFATAFALALPILSATGPAE